MRRRRLLGAAVAVLPLLGVLASPAAAFVAPPPPPVDLLPLDASVAGSVAEASGVALAAPEVGAALALGAAAYGLYSAGNLLYSWLAPNADQSVPPQYSTAAENTGNSYASSSPLYYQPWASTAQWFELSGLTGQGGATPSVTLTGYDASGPLTSLSLPQLPNSPGVGYYGFSLCKSLQPLGNTYPAGSVFITWDSATTSTPDTTYASFGEGCPSLGSPPIDQDLIGAGVAWLWPGNSTLTTTYGYTIIGQSGLGCDTPATAGQCSGTAAPMPAPANPTRTLSSSLSCSPSPGSSSSAATITASSSFQEATASGEPAAVPLPMGVCPAGTYPTGATVSLTTGSSSPSTVTTWSPATVPSSAPDYSCSTAPAGSACLLQVRRYLGTSGAYQVCGDVGVDCSGFVAGVQLDTAVWQCWWGTVQEPLSQCAPLLGTFGRAEPASSASSCPSHWWEVLNPFAILRTLKCAFVPTGTELSAQVAPMRAAFTGSFVGAAVSTIQGVYGGLTSGQTDSGSCHGLGFNAGDLYAGWSGTIFYPFDACSGLGAQISSVVEPLAVALLWLGAFFSAWRIVTGSLGVVSG